VYAGGAGEVMEAPVGERFSLVIFVAMAAGIGIVPWFRGGLIRYPHMWAWEAMLIALVVACFVLFRRAHGDVRKWATAQWLGLWLVIFVIHRLHRKIGCEVLMELGGIPDVCNRTRRDRPFGGITAS
jgi:hypothetical protein